MSELETMNRPILHAAVMTSLLLGACAHTGQGIQLPCEDEQYKQSSARLKEIYSEDQKDRENFAQWTVQRSMEVLTQDRRRRAAVAELFSKGCFKTADDYLNAATVFQHGEVPDHYFQAYVWAMKAFNMGNQEAGQMVGNGVDRYLMNLGYKQLFGGQAVTEPSKVSPAEHCFCLWPTEVGFPDSERRRLNFKTGDKIVSWLKELNAGKQGCSSTVCEKTAEPVPKGFVPGLW